MVTGIETVGLILAVLPLFVEAGKAYSEGVESILDVALLSHRDERLRDFYDDFYWEINELNLHIEVIADALSNKPGEQIHGPTTPLGLSQWSENPDVARRLKAYLGSDAKFNKFTVITKKLMRLLAQLLKDDTVHVSKKELTETAMYEKLKAFVEGKDSQNTKTTFTERFRFFKRLEDRETCLKKLGLWNERLEGLATQNGPEVTDGQRAAATQAALFGSMPPSNTLRALVRCLYTAFSRCWTCSCDGGHEAKLCLNIPGLSSRSVRDLAIDFEFVVSAVMHQTDAHCWREGVVTIKSDNIPSEEYREQLTKICDALKLGVNDFCLRLLIEDINGQQNIWQLRPKPKPMRFLDTEPPASLHELLGSAKMNPLEKRELALNCAYSLLLFHDSPWLTGGWGKGNISFFFASENEPDYRRPYLSARFDSQQEVCVQSFDLFHRNSNILALGLLLIEIFNEKPIEAWRNKKERMMVNVNTDWIVANRIVERMDKAPSRSAIQACLNIDWLPENRVIRLEDPDVRAELFKRVIQPLESEIAWCKQ